MAVTTLRLSLEVLRLTNEDSTMAENPPPETGPQIPVLSMRQRRREEKTWRSPPSKVGPRRGIPPISPLARDLLPCREIPVTQPPQPLLPTKKMEPGLWKPLMRKYYLGAKSLAQLSPQVGTYAGFTWEFLTSTQLRMDIENNSGSDVVFIDCRKDPVEEAITIARDLVFTARCEDEMEQVYYNCLSSSHAKSRVQGMREVVLVFFGDTYSEVSYIAKHLTFLDGDAQGENREFKRIIILIDPFTTFCKKCPEFVTPQNDVENTPQLEGEERKVEGNQSNQNS